MLVVAGALITLASGSWSVSPAITALRKSIGLVRFGMSSSLLHLMGVVIGFALGFFWLQRGWVDCEGWDLVHVMKGKEGTKHIAGDAEVEGEARALVRTSLKSRSQSAKASNPEVVVSKVRTSCSAGPPLATRTQATTVCLCTSSPAQRG